MYEWQGPDMNDAIEVNKQKYLRKRQAKQQKNVDGFIDDRPKYIIYAHDCYYWFTLIVFCDAKTKLTNNIFSAKIFNIFLIVRQM
jgi:hypothetical protein